MYRSPVISTATFTARVAARAPRIELAFSLPSSVGHGRDGLGIQHLALAEDRVGCAVNDVGAEATVQRREFTFAGSTCRHLSLQVAPDRLG